jgi:hypothetical protein
MLSFVLSFIFNAFVKKRVLLAFLTKLTELSGIRIFVPRPNKVLSLKGE